ncbi:MAG TPA: quinoprotein relay system zinc metallohydrolase 1 [Novosphingobium sp.]|nr:quinoprotein relay system zinc metallohydrolase 1 [Novosphingobium sp.]HZV10649.1 quinoprotein relay system zinc metallohydrolase 1 [Novosphingobium sp.]
MPTARRPFIASLLAAPLWAQAVLAEPFAGTYRLAAQPVAPGVWMVRGADQPIAFANGGAIANAAIIATDAGAVLVDCGPSLAYGRALAALARRLTGQAVALVLITHLHPDHALGAGAFDPAIVAALPGTIADIRRDGPGMTDAMFRLLADWMRGTELAVPGRQVAAGPLVVGGRRLQLLALSGHSQADLAVLDEATGTLIAGDLVFHNRAPATPHATLATWQQALGTLAATPHRQLIPGHGPLDSTGTAIAQTRDWLAWLAAALAEAADHGLEMTEAGDLPIPAGLAAMAEGRYELQRSVSHFYAALESARLPLIG